MSEKSGWWPPWGRVRYVPKNAEEAREIRRSNVRVFVTHLSAIYLFVGAPLLMALMFLSGKWEAIAISPEVFSQVKDLYVGLVPIATGVIAYWFGSRVSGGHGKQDNGE